VRASRAASIQCSNRVPDHSALHHIRTLVSLCCVCALCVGVQTSVADIRRELSGALSKAARAAMAGTGGGGDEVMYRQASVIVEQLRLAAPKSPAIARALEKAGWRWAR
jgi:hypothetical protein